jgi:parallel beta-helix repeat protein
MEIMESGCVTKIHYDGIAIYQYSNNTIINNTIIGNDGMGIRLCYDGSDYNTICGNYFADNGKGHTQGNDISLASASHNQIYNNIINTYGQWASIELWAGSSDYNNIYNNTIRANNSYNFEIICLGNGCNYNTISRNTIIAEKPLIKGKIEFGDTYFNKIYQNNFIDCYVSDEGYTNSWDNGPIEGGNYWSNHLCHGNPSNGSEPYIIDEDSVDHYPFEDPNGWLLGENIFDTKAPANPYPSIFGTHNGTIKPNQTINVSKLYTYPCKGTGGHTEYAEIRNATWNATATWEGYVGDWHNITFDKTVVLLANEEYNYTICTGSYPQIHHTDALPTENGWINCTKFTDANGKEYNDWIPAIRVW